ncbi:MAG: hypothetical protein QXD51_01870 [Candidatus Anstonellales archaeon]
MMRKVFFLLFFMSLLFSQPPCPGCEELFNAYESGIIAGLVEKNVDIYMYAVYNGERLPVGNATLFVEVYNATGDLYSRCRVFTDENGKAVFDLTPYNETCSGTGMVRGCTIGVKFCCSSSPNCLLQPCLNESITSFEDVSPCGELKPAPWPESAYINKNGQPIFATLSPTYAQVVYIPTLLPPLFGGTAPAICLPLFIIAGMLLAASYATGGSPFFWFDLNTLRFTTGQRARITGKGGITLSQARLVAASRKTIPGVNTAFKAVSSKITALSAKAGEAVGAWVTKHAPARIKGGLIRGRPAWVRERMGRVEEALKGVGKGRFWTGKKVKKEGEGGVGELRAGQQRVAIEAKQFGVSEIFSAALTTGFVWGKIGSLAEFFGVSQAIMRGVMAGAAREELNYLREHSSELQKLLEGKDVDLKVKEAIYSNLAGLYAALAEAEEEKAKAEAEKAKAEKDKAKAEEHKAKAEEYEAKAQLYTQLSVAFDFCSEIVNDPELLKTEEGKKFIAEITEQTNQAFLLSRTFDPNILKEAEEARKAIFTVEKETPEYQDLQATIDKAKPYEEAQNTLQIIASLSIAWKGNIRIGNDVISLGMNEGELIAAREILMDAYMNPEKYKAEREECRILGATLGADPKKLTGEDIELRRSLEKALRGDEKALGEVQNYFTKKAHEYELAYDVLTGKTAYQGLSEEDRRATLRGLEMLAITSITEARNTLSSTPDEKEKEEKMRKLDDAASFLKPETFDPQGFIQAFEGGGCNLTQLLDGIKGNEGAWSKPPENVSDLKIFILVSSS